MSNTETKERKGSLWEQILKLLEEDLAERRDRKVFVEVSDESGLRQKEIGELSSEELRSLEKGPRERVVERLVDRYLAEQGRVDLLKGRRPYTKDVRDLTPEDLPALIQADRQRAEEHREERERVEFVREVRGDLDRLDVAELVEIGVGGGRQG
jgi:hypothetical protein